MIIDSIDFENLPSEKFWSFPKSYKGNKKEETKNMFLSNNYLASLKNDGHYARFIKDMDGNMRLQGRSESVNGGYLNKIEWVPQCQEFFDSLPNGTCLLGELYFPKQRGSRKVTTILGCLKEKAIERQDKGGKLSYYIFDVWAWNGKSLLNIPFERRIDYYLNYEMLDLFDGEDNVERAIYYEGQEAWDKLGEYLSSGLEGMVLYKKSGLAEPGKRTARKTLKVKMEINQTIDAFIDGNYRLPTQVYSGKEIENWSYWQNEKTNEKFNAKMYNEYISGVPIIPITKPYYYGWASAISFSVMKDGKPTHIGYISGITDTMRSDMVNNSEKLVGKVYELSAMEVEKIQGSYSLRHGKIVQERPDKRPEDCTFDQIEQ
jgi:ATP-dependent DNA ligase